MKRSLVIFGILFLLMVSLASAGVLNYYGKVEGTAQVSGPMFYADLEGDNATNGTLLLNKKPSSNYTTTFSDTNSVIFNSSNLSGINFNYHPMCNFSVKANSTSNDSKLNLTCYYNNGTDNKICSAQVNVNSSPEIRDATCSNTSIQLSNVKYFVYEVKGTDSSVNYTIETNTNGDTYMQVTK